MFRSYFVACIVRRRITRTDRTWVWIQLLLRHVCTRGGANLHVLECACMFMRLNIRMCDYSCAFWVPCARSLYLRAFLARIRSSSDLSFCCPLDARRDASVGWRLLRTGGGRKRGICAHSLVYASGCIVCGCKVYLCLAVHPCCCCVHACVFRYINVCLRPWH